MKVSEIVTMLNTLNMPVTYYQFPNEVAPPCPFLCYYFPNSDNMSADNIVYAKINALNIELYTDKKDFALEETLESLLTSNGFYWYKSEQYLNTEHMYMVTYEMEAYINGE